jgi:hypothetical protein
MVRRVLAYGLMKSVVLCFCCSLNKKFTAQRSEAVPLFFLQTKKRRPLAAPQCFTTSESRVVGA